MNEANSATPKNKTGSMNCDQVAWILDIIERHEKVCNLNFPRVSRAKELSSYGAVLEIAEVLNLNIDKEAVFNLTADELRHHLVK